jgi:1-acyl-sn-glycerol-3-phosphate acyltransferase
MRATMTNKNLMNKNRIKPTKHIRTNELNLSIIIRSILLWLIIAIVTPFYAVIGCIIFPINLHTRIKIIGTWALLFTGLSKYLCGVDYEVVGKENFINTPAILASNHQSTWETMAFFAVLPSLYVVIIKRELLYIPFFGWALATISPIAINRNKRAAALQQVLTQGSNKIKQGFSILAFPEGTRIAPKVNANYKTGCAKIALALKLPITTIAHDAGYVMPKRSFWVYPGTVTIRIGKPIYSTPEDNPESLTVKIKQNITTELAIIDETKHP